MAAYSLPTAAARIPLVPSNMAEKQQEAAFAVGPESHEFSPRDQRGAADQVRNATAVEEEEEEQNGGEGKQRESLSGEQQQQPHQQQQQQQQYQDRIHFPTDGEEGEEIVDAQTLASGALTAAIIPGRLQRGGGGGSSSSSAGSGLLVAAGVALSGISFMSEQEGDDEGPLWKVKVSPAAAEELHHGTIGDTVGAAAAAPPPRVLGMRGIVSHSGARQALVVVWAERPAFQVLDVGRAGSSAGVVEEVSLERRHR